MTYPPDACRRHSLKSSRWWPTIVNVGCLVISFVCGGIDQTAMGADSPHRKLTFNRDIRPILSDNCFRCHGPDAASRESDLRLDQRESAVAARASSPAISPGEPLKSELLARITSTDDDLRMPPKSTDKKLTPAEIATLRQWIAQGADYQSHWAFLAPQRPPVPTFEKPGVSKDPGFCRNAIDAFVLKRLVRQGWTLSPEAEREAQIRRVTLDLTGLPPSLDEIDSFLADSAPGAYERVVDRLLASPGFGEQMAVGWLDAARYADTNGYFTDQPRAMWHWRDWVINAYNSNMPFDQFTVEQLAGDLLPQPSRDQLIATGFNRNHTVNDETGITEEEYRVEYVVDRLSTTSTIWLGLTVGCARCHDHKFDPISQREFYELFAFFNNGPERGLSGGSGNAAPIISVPTAEWLKRRDELQQATAAAQQQVKAIEAEIAAAQAAWEKSVLENLSATPDRGLVAHYKFDGDGRDSSGQERHSRKRGSPEFDSGLLDKAVKLDGNSLLAADTELPFERDRPFSFGIWMDLTDSRPVCLVSKNDDKESLRGFDLMVRKSRVAVHLVHRWNSNAIQVVTKQPITRNQWQHVMVTYDGSGEAAGVAIYLDGQPAELDIKYDSLTGSIHTDEPLRIGRRSTSAPYTGSLDELRLYDRQLTAAEVSQLAQNQLLRGINAVPEQKRSPALTAKLRQSFLRTHADPNWRVISEKAAAAARRERQFKSNSPTAMVMQDREMPRETFLLARGEYNRPTEKVAVDVPRSLPRLATDAPRNRLGLARWLVSPQHPLTARVAVNRMWQQFFGRGIVESVGDFGSQGSLPSHPDLLDWLAVEFVESGWNVKQMARLIVTSATYRQSSRITSEQAERDPENKWLTRGPRYRMNAEMLRDNALAISGLLVERLGGPSVKPYQPPGLWKAVVYDGNLEYQPDTGLNLYRRSLYSYWKRQSPPPALLAFDAPTRETCVVRRSRTNTPLQALVLMNDPTYVEAARVLAERIMREAKAKTPAGRAQHGFRLATARTPTPSEVAVLIDVYQAQLAEFQADVAAAKKLIDVGDSPVDPAFGAAELAAWTTVMQMILSLDETLTKE